MQADEAPNLRFMQSEGAHPERRCVRTLALDTLYVLLLLCYAAVLLNLLL